ncbi:hypothetical protein ACSHWG_07110 [Leucobacter sp. Z1108]|uniref:hypothetical protein n=1 Tax=Leucobacter sp. Z1108 TaxID=3439066 RepID=UPI003F407128
MTVPAVDYPSYTDTRIHLREVFDAVEHGRTVTMRRDSKSVSVVMGAERLRQYFFDTVSPRVEVSFENGGAIALMEGRPFASEGLTVEDALSDLILSLREYAEDWEDHLQPAPNHAGAWALVQLIKLSSDAELLEWLERGSE